MPVQVVLAVIALLVQSGLLTSVVDLLALATRMILEKRSTTQQERDLIMGAWCQAVERIASTGAGL